jgi:hypothetical protein
MDCQFFLRLELEPELKTRPSLELALVLVIGQYLCFELEPHARSSSAAWVDVRFGAELVVEVRSFTIALSHNGQSSDSRCLLNTCTSQFGFLSDSIPDP